MHVIYTMRSSFSVSLCLVSLPHPSFTCPGYLFSLPHPLIHLSWLFIQPAPPPHSPVLAIYSACPTPSFTCPGYLFSLPHPLHLSCHFIQPAPPPYSPVLPPVGEASDAPRRRACACALKGPRLPPPSHRLSVHHRAAAWVAVLRGLGPIGVQR